MALLGRKKIGREDHEKKQRRIDRLAEDWEEVGGSFNDSFQSTSSRNSNLSAKAPPRLCNIRSICVISAF